MFGTSGVRGPIGETVTAALALDIARAVAVDADRIVVGRDARDSGRALVDAVAAGAVECGVDVIDLGVAATPTVARAIAARGADAGVVVTASHNPPTDNGIKLWTPSGQAFDTAEQDEIERRIAADEVPFAAWDGHGTRSAWDGATAAHREALVDAGRRWTETDVASLDGLSVAVDVGNGTGGVTADALYDLGAAVTTLNAQPDGRFPARPSEPTAETCRGLVEHVAGTGADLGIAHDGDADRMMAVTGDGTFVSGDELLAVFGAEAAGEGELIAAPVDTSLAVDDALAEFGAGVVRTRVGDVYVAERTREEGVVFGGEPSGAWIFPDETRCPDGPLAAVVLAALAAERPLADRVADVPDYPIRRETVETDEKDAAMAAITDRVRASYDDVSEIDGVRVGVDDGWFLLRASGTQPLIRLTAEARDPERADEILAAARDLVADAVGER
ncbi:phosphoglucosamine mutase [Halorubrum aidingense JCM 13560]|uniref:Phosphoglucosamine mutase n=1 Tax=Halorubrum aidingense JCM 13560 TaxID=1230454 RepID=M0P5F7_9EURY|nr:phosphoglucosamine mutase [Halorubrum aidingense]EMA65311.1 phosphoglucosamine mutase [Halorubrum aidingense JCM 13560]